MPDRAAAKLTIRNPLGLHARPATALAQTAMSFPCVVTLVRDGERFDGKSVMELMMMAAISGTVVEVIAEGDDAEPCLRAITDLFERGFDED